MVKLLDILRENIAEGKQVGPIYHFTDYRNAIDVIKDGYVLKTLTKRMYGDNSQAFISFTRNKNLDSPTISREVRFAIDGDGLSNRYKIQPFADTAAGYGRNRSLTDESEERVDANPIGGELNFSKYLKSVDVLSPKSNLKSKGPNTGDAGFDRLMKYLKDNNIKFNLVDYYK